MKGKITFIGKCLIEKDIEYIFMKLLDEKGELNKEILPYPLDQEIVYGPILIVKMDENVEPTDLTLEEYNYLKKNYPPRRRSQRIKSQLK